jgi:hypothetical protein
VPAEALEKFLAAADRLEETVCAGNPSAVFEQIQAMKELKKVLP